ncbi:SapC family protein [Aureimonas fodinaquatilis]|uniref:SapC family protein n=1 Tax=Aureimonas fodinaquatilis TaxID=2565783 RepID=UPI001FEC3A06|nr:SapC family protein [Aureimonas fodinaquatilis]
MTKKTTTQPQTQDQTQPANENPLFYRSPLLLRFEEHAKFGLRRTPNYSFASTANVIPLTGSEFGIAGRQYPIVFSNDPSAMTLAVMGLTRHKNQFVDDAGNWQAGAYVPAYVRRYPFISINTEVGGNEMLGIDAASDRISLDVDVESEDVDAIFNADGEPTEAARSAISLCDMFSFHHKRTRDFTAAMLEHNLLVERSAEIKNQDGTQGVVNGFRVIDEEAFRALPDAVLVDFHAKGWTDMIVLHIASQLSWQTLLDAQAPAVQEAA